MPVPSFDIDKKYYCPCCGRSGTLEPFTICKGVNDEVAYLAICRTCMVTINSRPTFAHQDGTLCNEESQKSAHQTFYNLTEDDIATLELAVEDHRYVIDLVKSRLGDVSELVYMDVGYGIGYSLYAATQWVAHAIGVEFDDASMQRLCSALGMPPNLELHGTMDTLSRKADVVILWHTLEHIPHCPSFLRKLRENLAPGGSVFLQVPLLQKEAIVDVHFTFFGLQSLRYLFESQGFIEGDYWFDLENNFLTYMATRTD